MVGSVSFKGKGWKEHRSSHPLPTFFMLGGFPAEYAVAGHPSKHFPMLLHVLHFTKSPVLVT